MISQTYPIRIFAAALLTTCVLAPTPPAAAQQCPTDLTALPNWYEASPGFRDVAAVRVTATFTNAAGADMEFSRSGAQGTFEVWSVPSVLEIPVEVLVEPSGIVPPGGSVEYDLILDVSALPPGETTFALRQIDSDMFGTLPPELIPLQSVSFTCTVGAPATTSWSLALLALVLGTAAFVFVRRRVVGSSFTGLVSAFVCVIAAAEPAAGQPDVLTETPGGARQEEEAAYGTADRTMTLVPASACLPAHSSLMLEYQTDLDGWLYRTGGTAYTVDFKCPVSLPSGVRLERVILEACDMNSDGQVILNLRRCAAGLDTPCVNVDGVSTGQTETPGCGFFAYDLTEPIDNFTRRLLLQVTFFGILFDHTTRFRSIELYWRRQVSPAPQTTTFDDVPTGHPFFQHIEALAASGITGGCGGGDYCPNDPLTRGQMAVFLAKALGLHWPN